MFLVCSIPNGQRLMSSYRPPMNTGGERKLQSYISKYSSDPINIYVLMYIFSDTHSEIADLLLIF